MRQSDHFNAAELQPRKSRRARLQSRWIKACPGRASNCKHWILLKYPGGGNLVELGATLSQTVLLPIRQPRLLPKCVAPRQSATAGNFGDGHGRRRCVLSHGRSRTSRPRHFARRRLSSPVARHVPAPEKAPEQCCATVIVLWLLQAKAKALSAGKRLHHTMATAVAH